MPTACVQSHSRRLCRRSIYQILKEPSCTPAPLRLVLTQDPSPFGAVPYPPLRGGRKPDAAIHLPSVRKHTDSHASDIGHWLGMTGQETRASIGGRGRALPLRFSIGGLYVHTVLRIKLIAFPPARPHCEPPVPCSALVRGRRSARRRSAPAAFPPWPAPACKRRGCAA